MVEIMKRAIYLLSFVLLFASFVSAQKVYVTKTGTKYHRAGCKYLKSSSIEVELKDIADRYEPCKVCKPPVLKTSTTQKNSKPTTSKKKDPVSDGRCIATTKKGTRCKRKAAAGSNYCWQHGG